MGNRGLEVGHVLERRCPGKQGRASGLLEAVPVLWRGILQARLARCHATFRLPNFLLLLLQLIVCDLSLVHPKGEQTSRAMMCGR